MKIYCNTNREITFDQLIGKDVWAKVIITNQYVTDGDFYCKFIGNGGDNDDYDYRLLKVSCSLLEDASYADFLSPSEWAQCERDIWGKPEKFDGAIRIAKPYEFISTEEIAEMASQNIPDWDVSQIINLVRNAV